jgi:terminase small subunit / prophage DNA-packing protein
LLTQKEIAEHLDLDQSQVSRLCAEMGIDWKAAGMGEIRVLYIRKLREQAAGRATTGDLDLASERAALARASREKIDLQNAVTRKQLAPVSLIEEVLARAGARVAGVLDAVPGTIKRRFPDLPAEVRMVIKTEVAKARNIAAHMSPDDLVEDDDAVEKMAEGAD